jgi:hypothetical protein
MFGAKYDVSRISMPEPSRIDLDFCENFGVSVYNEETPPRAGETHV